MSLFDLQDVCIAIGSIATLDLPMVIDLIGIYGLKGPYCTLTTTNWFLQALSVIPRGSWGDVARRSYHDPLGRAGFLKFRLEPGTSASKIGNSKLLNRTPAAAVCGSAPSRAHARRTTCALAEANAGRISCDLDVWSSARRRSWSARLRDDARTGRVSGRATAPHDYATPCIRCCRLLRRWSRRWSAVERRCWSGDVRWLRAICARRCIALGAASCALPPRFPGGGGGAGAAAGLNSSRVWFGPVSDSP
ncbi:hypothetical protein F511_43315 [Dorcoceras hygrometricum]|uniref:Helicase domain-containing family protein n=1 Tax=Dorcoceras hygrometricum TaxID=472368 RepID=A0A2Z7AG70_9LAMI|nr:hypothetical protein F511_43315 [Dorcoceras hygrometricum]